MQNLASASIRVGRWYRGARYYLLFAVTAAAQTGFITNGASAAQPAPDLSVVVTDNSTPYNPAGSPFTQGQSGATYTVTVSNVGSAPTLGTVTVTNSLTTGLMATNVAGAGWSCVLGTLTCTRSDPLAVSGSYPVINVTATVLADAPGGVTNTVSVSGGGEANTANGTAGDYTTTFTAPRFADAWTFLNPPVGFDGALLMTDGTIMAHQFCTPNWYRLTPDELGNYATGTWSQAASMQAGYGPFAFSSAVLADGRLVVIGGEYNLNCGSGAKPAETNLGAIYDPKANSWTPLSAPSGWTSVGDASSVVLPSGQFMLAGDFNSQVALLDPVTLTWTVLDGPPPTEEAGWTLLPDGSVLMPGVETAPQSYRYIPQTNTWMQAGNTVATLVTGNEIGPQVLRPDGTVFVAGATGQSAIYNVGAGSWAAGPSFPGSGPGQLTSSDVPGTLMPNGHVLVQAFNTQNLFFFEFDGTNLNPVPGWFGCMGMLILPTGQISCSGGWVYNPTGSPDPAWAPTIATAPSAVQPGLTYAIAGTQFNGLSQAVGFGDDYQGATNYPLVRITNTATGHVFYCRTHNHSTMGVATGAALVSTYFDVPPSIEEGPSTLVVVANGIPSSPMPVTVAAPGPDLTLTKTHAGNFTQGQTGATYTLKASNPGLASTTGTVTVTDALPASLTATAIVGTGWSCDLGTLTCNRNDALAAGSAYPVITVTANVAANAPASVTNMAAVSGGGEINTANDTAADPTTIENSAPAPAPDLTVTKTHPGNFTQGQTGATYTLKASNPGLASTTGTVTVTDTLPASLTATAILGTGWSCDLGTLTCNRNDALAAGSGYPVITLTVDVAANAPASVTNMAAVSGGGEINTANDTASDPTMIDSGVPPPSITPGGVVAVDSTVTTIQPGEWVSIYGNNLGPTQPVTWTGNFPQSLGKTMVTIDGNPAYLSYVSPTQINLQAPNDSNTGKVNVVVTTTGGTSTSTVMLAALAPSFLLFDHTHVTGIIVRPDGSGAFGSGSNSYDFLGPTGNSLGFPTVAAKAGDSVQLYAVGLGPTNPAVQAGQPFSGAAPTTNQVTLTINKAPVLPSFAGFDSSILYQINLTIPAGLGTGDVPLTAAVAGAQTQSNVVISLQ